MKETLRKSQLAASNELEFKKLTRMQEGILNCSIVEEKESFSLPMRVIMHSHGSKSAGKAVTDDFSSDRCRKTGIKSKNVPFCFGTGKFLL